MAHIRRKRKSKSIKRRGSKKRGSKKQSRRTKRKSRRSGRKSRRRRFGYGGLLDVMSNYGPSEMSLSQQTTGYSPGQMATHMENIPVSYRDKFYT